jgi:hypothetical protein
VKYKVGDTAIDPEEPDYTFLITRVNKKTYRYRIFFDGTFTHEMSFQIKRFEEETRKLTKLDKALK